MSTNGETADLMVREGIQITESVVKLAGLGAKNLAALLIAVANRQDYGFWYGADEQSLEPFYLHADGKLINPEEVGGMVGTLLGIFASGNGTDSSNEAAFDWFDYKAI